jgi:hypothetical protein
MNASDIDVRVANEGRTPLAPLVHVHELREGGEVTSDGNVKVTAAPWIIRRLFPPSPTDSMPAIALS